MKLGRATISAGVWLSLVFSSALFQAHAFDTSKSYIEHIKGDVYYAQHPVDDTIINSIFLVTEEGIILVDPVHADAAAWTKAQIKERFDKPVKYVIYSHFHWDHAPGAEVFSDTVIDVIAHENVIKNIQNDTSDKKVKVLPTKTYKNRMEIVLGGKSVELLDITSSHTDGSTVVRFPEEKIIFSVDVAPVGRVMWRYAGGWMPDGVNDMDMTLMDIETILALDFDIIAPGHYLHKTRDDLIKTYNYILDMCYAVSAQIEAGNDLPTILETVTMSEYSDLLIYDLYLKMNVEGMHYWLTKKARSDRTCGTLNDQNLPF